MWESMHLIEIWCTLSIREVFINFKGGSLPPGAQFWETDA